ncbi:glycosyltransferase involved in cell wall biosynthesis [Metabacillus crassostreae]|uniref:glycosyltransferase family A protein n=1 Tax=Metabacillus crassostreae TaxID=929098 RepID=UPI00195EDB05|nr:glycosyltransferase family A protein [Metabacillus crassostreae]MBM7606286.1 glycosyltransferase involved in cell wall biosynthesis [Metabacillus crassostreae]
MKVEVLVSTMHQKDLTLINKMNIKGDAIIINQCDRNEYIESNDHNRSLRMYSFSEFGVGKSRNNALMRSTGDICLMADDDMVYVDNYEEIVLNAFIENPKADMILFNVPILKKNGQKIIKVKENKRVSFFNSLKYGTVNIAYRREKIIKRNIFFSLLFGGGARYGCGEDSIFITESLKKGMKIYSNKSIIAEIQEGESTWFTGYNEKFFFDKGALFAAISKKGAYLLAIQFIIRKRKLYLEGNLTLRVALRNMLLGIRNFKK